MVPMFTCGLLRSNFSFAISSSAPQSKSFELPCYQPGNQPRTANPDLSGRFAGGLLDHFLRDRNRRFGIMRKMHGESGAALSAAAQIGGVTEHLRERHFHSNDVAAGAVFRALNRRTPRIQVAE